MVPEEENDGLLDAERHQARHTIAPRAQLFPVAEKFVSVNGEGLAAGRPAAFIRFAGCNMWCTYCDTRWANHPLVEVEGWSVPDLVAWVAETGVSCVTLTGGEPVLQPLLPRLVGLPLAQAKGRLWELGLNVGRVDFDEGVNLLNLKDTRVYIQTPGAERGAALGSKVDLRLTLDEKKLARYRAEAEKQAAVAAEERRAEEQQRADSLARTVLEEASAEPAEERPANNNEGFFD